MHLSLDIAWLSAFLLAMTRATAFVFVAPPFNSAGMPTKVRLGLAMGFALFVARWFPAGTVLLDSWGFITGVVYQAAIGLAMGFAVYLLVAAAQSAGALIDLSAGFSAGQVYDPFSNTTSSPVARLYQLLATTILVASGGLNLVVKGFLASFGQAGTRGGTSIEQVGRILVHDFGTYFAAAIQIAVPVVAALFLAEIAIGLVARAAPQVQILPLSFAVKMGAALILVGLAIRILPAALFPLVNQAAESMMALGR